MRICLVNFEMPKADKREALAGYLGKFDLHPSLGTIQLEQCRHPVDADEFPDRWTHGASSATSPIHYIFWRHTPAVASTAAETVLFVRPLPLGVILKDIHNVSTRIANAASAILFDAWLPAFLAVSLSDLLCPAPQAEFVNDALHAPRLPAGPATSIEGPLVEFKHPDSQHPHLSDFFAKHVREIYPLLNAAAAAGAPTGVLYMGVEDKSRAIIGITLKDGDSWLAKLKSSMDDFAGSIYPRPASLRTLVHEVDPLLPVNVADACLLRVAVGHGSVPGKVLNSVLVALQGRAAQVYMAPTATLGQAGDADASTADCDDVGDGDFGVGGGGGHRDFFVLTSQASYDSIHPRLDLPVTLESIADQAHYDALIASAVKRTVFALEAGVHAPNCGAAYIRVSHSKILTTFTHHPSRFPLRQGGNDFTPVHPLALYLRLHPQPASFPSSVDRLVVLIAPAEYHHAARRAMDRALGAGVHVSATISQVEDVAVVVRVLLHHRLSPLTVVVFAQNPSLDWLETLLLADQKVSRDRACLVLCPASDGRLVFCLATDEQPPPVLAAHLRVEPVLTRVREMLCHVPGHESSEVHLDAVLCGDIVTDFVPAGASRAVPLAARDAGEVPSTDALLAHFLLLDASQERQQSSDDVAKMGQWLRGQIPLPFSLLFRARADHDGEDTGFPQLAHTQAALNSISAGWASRVGLHVTLLVKPRTAVGVGATTALRQIGAALSLEGVVCYYHEPAAGVVLTEDSMRTCLAAALHHARQNSGPTSTGRVCFLLDNDSDARLATGLASLVACQPPSRNSPVVQVVAVTARSTLKLRRVGDVVTSVVLSPFVPNTMLPRIVAQFSKAFSPTTHVAATPESRDAQVIVDKRRQDALRAAEERARSARQFDDFDRHIFVFGLTALRAEFTPATRFVEAALLRLDASQRQLLYALALVVVFIPEHTSALNLTSATADALTGCVLLATGEDGHVRLLHPLLARVCLEQRGIALGNLFVDSADVAEVLSFVISNIDAVKDSMLPERVFRALLIDHPQPDKFSLLVATALRAVPLYPGAPLPSSLRCQTVHSFIHSLCAAVNDSRYGLDRGHEFVMMSRLNKELFRRCKDSSFLDKAIEFARNALMFFSMAHKGEMYTNLARNNIRG